MTSQFVCTSYMALGALRSILYYLVSDAWGDGKVLIVTPNVEASAYEAIREDFRRIADADNLDLDVFIYSTLRPGTGPSTKWKFGWDDGQHITVYIYPKEVFQPGEPLPEFISMVPMRARK